MAVMGYLRERMGKIVAGVIGVSLVAFVITEVVQSGGSYFREDNSTIGEVAGEKIPYEEFNTAVEQNSAQFKQQSGQNSLSPQIMSYVQANTWNQFLTKVIVKKEVEKLGLTVSYDEIKAMTLGNNVSPQIVQAFTDPQTGQFDKANATSTIQRLESLPATDPQKEKWLEFKQQVVDAKKTEKYMALVSNSLYVNSLDAKDDYEAKNKLVNFKYTVLPYASIADDKVKLTDADYQAYYDEHKGEFKNPQELRSIDYASFNAAPSKEDSAVIKEAVEKIKPELVASTNDSLFVQINSETKAPLAFKKKGTLGGILDSVMFTAAPGFVYGPYMENGSYALAKLVAAQVGPDSVKAKHILISPAEGIEKALAKADSIKKQILGGKSFAEMAEMYSMDKNSAIKGGDLGTFGRGAMIPVFEDAVFNGKVGDYKTVTSQYGVHLIQIDAQKGSSKVVKVAVVDKPLTASSKTQSAAYSKAQAFLASLGDNADFAAQAKKAGVEYKTADNIVGTAAGLPGLDNARDLVRWVYKAEKGETYDQVFTVGDQYIVARLSAIKPKGTLALADVKTQIEPFVRNYVKAKQLSEKLAAASNGASTVEQVAQKVGATVTPVQNIVLANPVIPGQTTEYKVIGAIFGSKVNKVSKPVDGQSGVYVFSVDSFVNPAPLTNLVRQKEQIAQANLQRAQGQILQALIDKANVKDNRARLL